MVECDSSGNDLRTTMIRESQWSKKYYIRLNNPLKEHYLLVQEINLIQLLHNHLQIKQTFKIEILIYKCPFPIHISYFRSLSQLFVNPKSKNVLVQ